MYCLEALGKKECYTLKDEVFLELWWLIPNIWWQLCILTWPGVTAKVTSQVQ